MCSRRRLVTFSGRVIVIILLFFSGNAIFWCDAQHDLIETSDLDGNNRRVVGYLADDAHPFGLAVNIDHIFWSDWTTRSVYCIDRNDGNEIQLSTGEDVFLRLQGMTTSTVSYPLDGKCI